MKDELNSTERLLMGELFQLTQDVASFALRVMGADAQEPEPVTGDDEYRLGSRLVDFGAVLQTRATQRGQFILDVTDDPQDLQRITEDSDTKDLINTTDEVLSRLRLLESEILSANNSWKEQMTMVTLLTGLAELLREYALSRADVHGPSPSKPNS